jgi:hypothetical protein
MEWLGMLTKIPGVVDVAIHGLGWVGAGAAVLFPWFKPAQTKKIGVMVGAFLAAILGQTAEEKTNRLARTAKDICEGIVEGLEADDDPLD